jgi:o-succinylbenzoate synthase
LEPKAIWSRAYAPKAGIASSVRFGFETAWLDTIARQSGLGLHVALGDDAHSRVPINALLDDFSPASLDAVSSLCQAGYGCVKVKVGRAPLQEEARAVCALLEQLPEACRLRLDANRAWTLADAVWFCCETASPRIDYIEEPVRDTEDLYEFMGESPIPAAIDETLMEQGGRALREFEGIAAAVLKPTLLGGLLAALSLAEAAWQNGVQPVISATFESGIGTAALAHLAAVVQAPETAAGLDTYRWLSEDLIDPPLDLSTGSFNIEQHARTLSFLRTDRLEKVAYG